MRRRNTFPKTYLLPFVFLLGGLAGCGLLSSDDNDQIPFDAGPILFIYNGQLWSMEEDGSDVQQLTHDPDFPILDAEWSPDGSKIAITGKADPGNPEEFARAIYIMNTDGTGRYQLTNPPLGHFRYVGDVEHRFAWSSDGKKIVFSRMRPPEFPGIFDTWIVDLESKEESRITSEHLINGSFPVGWFPDKNKILLLRRINSGSKSELVALDLEKDELYTYTYPFEGPLHSIILSPSGEKIALGVYIMDSNGKNFQKIKDPVYIDSAQAWSPDSERIIYLEEHKRERAFTPIPLFLKMIDLTTGEEKDISPFNYRELFDSKEYYTKRYRVTSWRGR
jgi:Tol biopolymer transport system component